MNKSVRDIAKRASVRDETVRAWESGEAVPSGIEFTRVLGLFHGLERFRRALNDARDAAARPPPPSSSSVSSLTHRLPLRGHMRNAAIEGVDRDLVRSLASTLPETDFMPEPEKPKSIAPPPPPPPPPPPAAAPPVGLPPSALVSPQPAPRSFGEALYWARTRAELTTAELGQLVGVTANAVNTWERNEHVPCENFLSQLYTLLKPHGLVYRIRANRSRPGNQYGPKGAEPVSPALPAASKSLADMSPEELKREHAIAIARANEIKNEIAERRERLLAQAKELET